MGVTLNTGQLSDVITFSNGNIGIGGSPSGSYKFEVTGNIRGTGTAYDLYTSSGLGTSAASGLLRVITAGTSTGIAIGQANSSRYTAIQPNEHIIYNDDFFMRTNGAFPLSLGTNNTIRMTITSTGNVGIGTSSPTNSLTIKAAATNKGIDFTSLADNSVIVGSINFEQTNDILSIIQKTAYSGGAVVFGTNSTERMRITSGGALCIGTTSAGSQTRLRVIDNTGGQGTQVAEFSNAAYLTTYFYTVNSDNWNAAGTAVAMGRNSSTGRSINAGGTINASGADYAEYMLKAIDETINKGDIVGVNENGELTNIFADAKSFVVKSTNPSYVGGDTWGSVDEIGKMPENPTDEEKAEYEAKLEAARKKVDRVAFSGQVPCNVLNAQVGDYIIPINNNGKIAGQSVTNPTFEQYQISVGKVWKIMEDGRAWIAVKIG